MPTALAISPHLDDAVFSAGGTLAGLARDGWRVIVVTVFTASVADPQGFALACQLDKGLTADIDYMALRRDEDAVACARLGAEPLWLAFAEAPHRGYASALALFAEMRDDDTIVTDLEPVLRTLIRSRAPDAIFAPQAIGAHVDHVAVYKALQSCRVPLRLWADFPYVSRASVRASPFETEIDTFIQEKVELGPDAFNAKISATAAYASQLGFQFGGIGHSAAALDMHGREEIFRRTR